MGAVYGMITLIISVVFGLKLVPITATTAGVLMAIPFFGPFVAWLPPVLDALIFSPDVILQVTVLVGIGWFVVMNILQPRLMAGAVGLHPIVVLGSVLVGGKVAGVAGAIFGIPIAAIVTALHAGSSAARAGRCGCPPSPGRGSTPRSRTRRSAPALLPVAEDLAGSVLAGNAGEPAARVGA